MKKLFFSVLLLLLFSISGRAQDSCGLRISLLTCAPGSELYSTFGHTAIRVQDVRSGMDAVYNYGTFEFDNDFYMKFVRGKLLYALSVEPFAEFMYQYQYESRSVVAQDLALTCAQKQQLYQRLAQNALPQNRAYRYDFLFDNCTTRARDMIDSGAAAAVQPGNILPARPLTFRDHITVYLNRAHQDWSKLGIDLLLGAKMDRPASNTEAMFLPDNLMVAFDRARADGHPLVAAKHTLLDMPSLATGSYLLTPVVSFVLLLLVVAALSFARQRWARKVLPAVDFVLFVLLGLVGVLLLFMWFGTDHALCANNYNLLWALPTHLIAAFFVHRAVRWRATYFAVVFWESVALLAFWAFLPQQLNSGFLPLVATIALRSWFLSKQNRDGDKRVSL